MTPQIFALLAAFCYAASHVASKRGLVTASVPAAVLINLSAAFAISATAVVFDPPGHVDVTTIALFSAAGLVAPGIARWASTMGVHRLGPSISIPIAQGTNPLLATCGGVLFLHESLTLLQVAGLLAIVSGSLSLSRYRPDQLTSELPIQGPAAPQAQESKPGFKPGIIFPILAAVAYATSSVLVKSALSNPQHAAFGATVGTASALIAWALGSLRVTRLRRQIVLGRGIKWLVLSGVLTGVATLSLFAALRFGNVSIVSPIVASQSLFVFLLSRAILRHIEDLPLSTVLAGTLVAVGTAAVGA